MSEATLVSCERCGAMLPAGARFCPNCGFPVGVSAAEERKIVSVLFADLMASTELSASLDPERFREVMATFYQAVSEELEWLRGRAETFAGDAVLGVFGVPQAHDDDALRAVRAGLSIVERVARLGELLALPVPLRVRVGVNTGPVAVGPEPAERGPVLGAMVNLAARLQQAAEAGEVLVGETTRQLTSPDVEYGSSREVTAKGFAEAVFAWPVVSLARSSRRTIPFVDRKRELALVANTFERAEESRRTHTVTLFGEAGIGKSRLAEEFLAGLPEGTKTLIGRASPFEEDVTFAPLAQMILAELRERSDAPQERIMARLKEAVAERCPPGEVEPVAAQLGVVLGLEEEEGREGNRYRAAEIRGALLAFLEGLAGSGPIVMLFEDLHLAQPSLLDLIDQLVREAPKIPLLILCAARYALLDERPDWGGGRGDSLNLYLEDLSLRDATRLAHDAGEGLDDEAAERIAQHAGGNPFFIVETTGMLLHRDAEMPAAGAALPSRLLPPTVQAVVAARIDHLPEAARDLVRKASVFARSTFEVAELELIAEPREDLLKLLEDEELLVRDDDEPDVWRFRHPLVRDVAYESLAKRERRRLHLRLADALSEPGTAERYPRAIAYHLEQAARAGLDLDPGDRSLADRAVEALARAGHPVKSGTEPATAVDLYERALALAGSEPNWGPREARILSELGEARYWLGEFESAAGPLIRALEIGGEDIMVRAHASRFLADMELSIHANKERASALFDQALGAARQLGDPWTLARTLLSAGWAPYWRGDLESARSMFEEALAVARANPDRDAWGEARALVTLATIISPSSDEEESLSLARQALGIGEEMDDPFTVAVAREAIGNSLRRMWRLVEAGKMLDAAVAAYRELGARWELASGLIGRGVVHRLSGRLPDAGSDLREALRICRDLEDRSLVSWAGGQLALVRLAMGNVEAAREAVEAASAQIDALDHDDLIGVRSLIALAEGDRERALSEALRLLEVERERAWPNDLAGAVWWTGSVFGPDLVGGDEDMQHARKTLEGAHWEQALREPQLESFGESRG